MSDSQVEQLLREGIAAAKAGNKATARELLRHATELDQYSEKAWYWLASVVETDEERRVCLGNVVVINPKNERAKQLLDELISSAGGMKAVKKAPIEREKQPPTPPANMPATAEPPRPAQKPQADLGFTLSKPLPDVSESPSTSPIGKAVQWLFALDQRHKTMIGAGVGIVVGGCLLLTLFFGGGSSSSPTAVAQATQPATATSTPSVTPTLDASQPTPTATGVALTDLPPTWTPRPTQAPANYRTPMPTPPPGVGVGRMLVSVGNPLTLDRNLPIALLDAKTGSITVITKDERGNYAVFLPEGTRMLFTRFNPGTDSEQLRIVRLNNTQGREFSEFWGSRPVLAEHRMVSISRNGRVVVFSALSKLENDVSTDIYWLPVEFAPLVTATPSPTATEAGTPDSSLATATQLATVEATPTEAVVTAQATQDATLAVTTAELKRVTEKDSGDNTWPAVSADGTRVLFVSNRPGFGTDLYVRTIDGQNEINLTQDGDTFIESAPRWSPDGTQIVFAVTEGDKGNSKLYIMSADGSNRALLVGDEGNNIRPVWSPDGKYVAFTSNRTNKNQIFIIDINTRSIYQATDQNLPVLLHDWSP